MEFKDGLYHWQGKLGAHRSAVLAETPTHFFLIGNYLEEDHTQGSEAIVWPVEHVNVPPFVATPKFLSSQRPVWHRPKYPIRSPLWERPVIGEAIEGDGFIGYPVPPPPFDKGITLGVLHFSVRVPPPVDKTCSCGEAAVVAVAVMTLEGSFESTEAFCKPCFMARQAP